MNAAPDLSEANFSLSEFEEMFIKLCEYHLTEQWLRNIILKPTYRNRPQHILLSINKKPNELENGECGNVFTKISTVPPNQTFG